MKRTYLKLWSLAKSYYRRGRPTDVEHITWMMNVAENLCEHERLDDTLLLPLVILHDVGYAEVHNDDPFKLDIRRAHMIQGATIARRLLKQIGYPQDKSRRIVHYISVHDNWAFGETELFASDKILGIFNDLDYLWMLSPKGFIAVAKILKKTPAEMVKYIEENDRRKMRPFSTETTKRLHEQYLNTIIKKKILPSEKKEKRSLKPTD